MGLTQDKDKTNPLSKKNNITASDPATIQRNGPNSNNSVAKKDCLKQVKYD